MNTGPYSNEKVQAFVLEQFIPVRSQCYWDKPTPLMQRLGIRRRRGLGQGGFQRLQMRCVPFPLLLRGGIDRLAHLPDARRENRPLELVELKYGVVPRQADTDADAGDLRDDVVEALDVLDIDGSIDVDAVGEQLLDVEITLGMAAAGRVGMGELVDQRDFRAAYRQPSDKAM